MKVIVVYVHIQTKKMYFKERTPLHFIVQKKSQRFGIFFFDNLINIKETKIKLAEC